MTTDQFLKKHAKAFIKALYTGVPGYIEIRPTFIVDKPKNYFRGWAETSDLENAVLGIREAALNPETNTYIGMSTRRDLDVERPGGKHNLQAVKHLWIDADNLETKKDFEEFWHKMDDFPLPPSIVARSGSAGMHAYWILDECIDLTERRGISILEYTLLGLSERFSSDPAVKEAARVMRVPGTLNRPTVDKRKAGRKTSFCKLKLFKPDRIYSLKQFKVWTSVGKNYAKQESEQYMGARIDRTSTPGKPEVKIPNFVLSKGSRHPAMVKFALSMRYNGCTPAEIEANLLKYNDQCCSPSKEASEVRDIARWACRMRV